MVFVKCSACGERIDKTEATKVPENYEQREKWKDIFGGAFPKNCEKYKCPYVCASHFDDGKLKKRKSLPNSVSWARPAPELQDHWFYKIPEKPESPVDTPQLSELSESSEYIPSADAEDVDDGEGSRYEEPAKHYDYKYCITSISSIVALLKTCRVCQQEADVHVSQSGFNLSITCYCSRCDRTWRWCNSEMCEAGDEANHRGRLRELHLDITGAVFLTGSSFQKIKQFFDVLNCSTFSARTYNKLKSRYVYQAVGIHYNDMLQWVQEMVGSLVHKDGSINLIGDGSYDSRGRCASYCRYVVMEATLKLAIDYEVLRQKSGESQQDMELKGFEKCLKRVAENFSSELNPNAVASFTTDRSKSIATSMMFNFPYINHYYDSWHFFRNIAMDIMKKRKLQKFKPIADWVRSFLNHLYYSVSESNGNGQLAKERVLSFFYHITDKHKNFDTGKWFKLRNFTECEHEDYDEFDERSACFLNSNSKSDVKALNILFSILKKGKRLEDIKKVSPYYATSCIESLNSRAIAYATKDHYFSEDGFKIRTMLTVIDWNERRRDEIEGRRVVIGEKPYYNKTSKRISTKEVKTPTNYNWRRKILNIAHVLRASERRESFGVGNEVDCEDTGVDVQMDEDDSNGAHGLSNNLEEEDVDSVWDKLVLLHEDEYDSGDEIEEREIDSIWDQLPIVEDDEEDEIDDGEDIF